MLLTHLWDADLYMHAVFQTCFPQHSHYHLSYSSCDNPMFMQLKYYIYIFLSLPLPLSLSLSLRGKYLFLHFIEKGT